jgi:cation:H+ antiporter
LGSEVLLWIGFLICTSVIVFSGIRLSRYGDIIAEKTGLGKTWVGVALMASVTSLPELFTGISSVTYADVPDIAAGDVLGSCVFNMLIIALLDAIYRIAPISAKAHQGNVLSAGFGILMLSIVALGLYSKDVLYSFGWVGVYSAAAALLYLIAMRVVFSYEKRQIALFLKEEAIAHMYDNITTKTAVINYIVNAAFVVVAAIFLPKIGEGIAEVTGLGQTFVGNIFISVSTSLPEVVVSVAAVRMDAVDLAIGNLFGSNIFNIFILALDDLLFIKGPILSFVNPNHLLPALSAIAMTTIAIIGLTYRAEKKRLFLAWDSIGIVALYIMNMMLLYMKK